MGMKSSLWFASILLFVLIMPLCFSKTPIRDANGQASISLAFLQEKRELADKVPAAQEPTPGPTETLEVTYPIEPGTSPLGLIIGAAIIVLTVLGGVVYASLMRRKN